MRTYRFDILVRDKAPANMEAEKCVVDWVELTDLVEIKHAFSKKLNEELDELDDGGGLNRQKDLGEMADVAEVAEALENIANDEFYQELHAAKAELDLGMDTWSIDSEELLEARAAKNRRNGAFTTRAFVRTVAVPEERQDIISYYQEKGFQEISAT